MSPETAHTSAESGTAQIEWARRFMPLSAATVARLEPGKGSHIGIALPLYPASASLAMWLMDAGFAVSILIPESADIGTDLLAAIGEAGANICDSREAFLECGCGIVLGEDSDLLPKGVSGAVLTSAGPADEQTVPIIDLSASPLIHTTMAHGVGQACVSGFLDITNLQIAGSRVLVIGYDYVGKGVAQYARSYGARVIVSEQDPVRAVMAKLDGHEVHDVEAAIPKAAVVFHASREEPGLSMSQIEALPSGAFLCCATQNADAFPLSELETSASGTVIRDHVSQYDLESRTKIKLVCGGGAVHVSSGMELPLEFADLQVAAQLHAIGELTASSFGLGPGIYALPETIEKDLAKAFLLEG